MNNIQNIIKILNQLKLS